MKYLIVEDNIVKPIEKKKLLEEMEKLGFIESASRQVRGQA